MGSQKSDKFKKIPKKTPKKVVENYIDNEVFYAEMTAYHALWCNYLKEVDLAEKAGKTPPRRPQPSDYIGKAFSSIAKNLSMSPNFCNYSYRDEMICDGIVNCLNYIGNFDPAKSKNPFAYFTQICFFAFLRRMEMEKKNQLTKYRYARHKDTGGKLSKLLSKVASDTDPDTDPFQQIFDLTAEEAVKMEDAIERKNEKVKGKNKTKAVKTDAPEASEPPVGSLRKRSKITTRPEDKKTPKKHKRRGFAQEVRGIEERELACYSMADFFEGMDSETRTTAPYTDIMCEGSATEYIIRGITGGH